MRDRLISSIGVLILVMGCSGCSNSAVSPTPTPTPPPPFGGEWFGFIDIMYLHPLTGQPVEDVCDHEWTVDTQNGAAFSGRFRANGGRVIFPRGEECIQSGALSGSVSSSAAISGLTFNLILGGPSINLDCTAVARPTFIGTTNGLSMTVQATDTIRCLVADVPTLINRTLTIHSNKRD
jgi:hypothetical protein